MAVPLKPKPALIATVAAYHNYVPDRGTFPVKTAAAAGFSEGAMVLLPPSPSWETDTFFHGGDPGAQPSAAASASSRLASLAITLARR